jgi:hypothetical protein
MRHVIRSKRHQHHPQPTLRHAKIGGVQKLPPHNITQLYKLRLNERTILSKLRTEQPTDIFNLHSPRLQLTSEPQKSREKIAFIITTTPITADTKRGARNTPTQNIDRPKIRR